MLRDLARTQLLHNKQNKRKVAGTIDPSVERVFRRATAVAGAGVEGLAIVAWYHKDLSDLSGGTGARGVGCVYLIDSHFLRHTKVSSSEFCLSNPQQR